MWASSHARWLALSGHSGMGSAFVVAAMAAAAYPMSDHCHFRNHQILAHEGLNVVR